MLKGNWKLEIGNRKSKSLSFFHFPNSRDNRGFTLIEMAVVTAIFGILTSVVIFNYGNFTDNILSTNMAYEVALQVRQAQVFGLGVRGVDGKFGGAYGVFINKKDVDSTKDIILFNDSKPVAGPDGKCGDSTGAGVCICNTRDECLEKITLQRNIIIDKLRVKGSGSSCDNDVDLLSVTFKRPNPDAIIRNQDSGASTNFELAEIRINSPRSARPRYVIIRNTGQISVEQKSVCIPGE